MANETSPLYLDRAAVRERFGLTRVDVDRVFRVLPVVSLPGSRKVYIRLSDLEAHLDQFVYPPGERIRVS